MDNQLEWNVHQGKNHKKEKAHNISDDHENSLMLTVIDIINKPNLHLP
jgi:hypothetical protein